MGHHWRPVQTADNRGPVWEARVAVINENLNIGIHPPPTVGLIIQTVGNQRTEGLRGLANRSWPRFPSRGGAPRLALASQRRPLSETTAAPIALIPSG